MKEVIPLYEEEEQDFGVIEGTDEDGNKVLLQVLDYFFYNGEEYAILTDAEDMEDCDCDACEEHQHHEHCCCSDCADEETDNEEITCYIMKVITSTEEDGEEVEEFVPVDDELEAKLVEVATTKLNAIDDAEEDEE